MYRIRQFDDVVITDLTKLPRGGSNDMGSGDALTSFQQLPGGGFVDNYGPNISPQGIRPITRNCVIFAPTDAEMISSLKALRAKIGVRGRLTVEFDNGELWWQWARLQRVHTPRPEEAKGYLPCNLVFITAAQHWYGLIQSGDPWQVGDETFYLGDGTVSVGMNDYVFDIEAGIANGNLPNDGNIDVRNLQIVVSADELMSAFALEIASEQRITWSNPGIADAFTVTIDTGAKSCLVRMDTLGVTTFGIDIMGATVRVITVGAHGFTTGDSIEIGATDTILDGVHHNISVTSTTEFTFIPFISPLGMGSLTPASRVYPVVDSYAALAVYNRKDWIVLRPGDNPFVLAPTVAAGTPLQEHTIRFRWYAHYR